RADAADQLHRKLPAGGGSPLAWCHFDCESRRIGRRGEALAFPGRLCGHGRDRTARARSTGRICVLASGDSAGRSELDKIAAPVLALYGVPGRNRTAETFQACGGADRVWDYLAMARGTARMGISGGLDGGAGSGGLPGYVSDFA